MNRFFEVEISREELMRQLDQSIRTIAVGLEFENTDDHRQIASTLVYCHRLLQLIE